MDAPSIRLVARFLGWLLVVVIAFLSLSPPSYRPVTALGHNLEHFSIHLLLGAAFGVGYARRWCLLALVLIGLVGALEFAQLFVPGRHARMNDLLIDSGAACLGLAVAWVGSAVRSVLSRRAQPIS